MACVCVMVLSGVGIYKLLVADNSVASNFKDVIEESDARVDIYSENQVTSSEKQFNLTFLGELMMGGNIGENLDYNYKSAFRTISGYISKADYTVVNLGTNVIDLDELKNTSSKYIVTKEIENAFYALGVDGINLASDHMLDFGKSIFNDTKKLLEDEYDLIGLKDTIVYAEHEGIKVAIIGVCNEVIGAQNNYTSAGIMMYNMKKIKSMITEASKNVDTVILLTHLGIENTHTVTNIMSWFYKELIKAGADIVLGSHALGVYPVEMYKGKPIVYSMGYLMHDTDYAAGKKTGIFNIVVNEQGKLEALEIRPLYINSKRQTVLYEEYNEQECIEFLNYLTSKLDKKQFKYIDNKVRISLNS